uniref:Uncharacterized protein n=1 Tax=Arundo donax TaxID=35708 RepID=A0A0A9AX02_ARUDO
MPMFMRGMLPCLLPRTRRICKI